MEVHHMTSSRESVENCEGGEALVEDNVSFVNTQLYSYRWFILTLYSLTAFSNTLVWLSLFTVSDATVTYYRIKESELLLASIAFTLMQVIVAIPVSCLPSRLGLRATMVIAAITNALGASIMIACTHRDGFPFFIVGQSVIALASTMLPQLAPEISAIWFGEKEHALSTSIGIIFGNAGAAIGFLQPALMISNIQPEKHIDVIGEKLKQLVYSQAALCILLMFLVFVFFKKGPNQPPSLSQASRKACNEITWRNFKEAYKLLLKSKSYLICANSFALNNLLLIVVPVLLNGIMSWKYPFRDATVGWMGFGGIISGIVGSIIFSLILDKTQAFKILAIFLGVTSFLFWFLFTEVLAYWDNLPLIFTLFICCLFTFIPVGPVLVDMITEMTYPVSESMSFVVPITLGRFYSIPVVFLLGHLVDKNDYFAVCFIIAGVIGLSALLVIFVKFEMKRGNVGKTSSDQL